MKDREYIRARDEILASGDVDRLIEFFKEQFGETPEREVAEITMHKSRTGATSLPIEMRRESKKWLTARGYTSFDDGEL